MQASRCKEYKHQHLVLLLFMQPPAEEFLTTILFVLSSFMSCMFVLWRKLESNARRTCFPKEEGPKIYYIQISDFNGSQRQNSCFSTTNCSRSGDFLDSVRRVHLLHIKNTSNRNLPPKKPVLKLRYHLTFKRLHPPILINYCREENASPKGRWLLFVDSKINSPLLSCGW